VAHRRQRIVLETERHHISGLITLSRDGYRSRVSDVLNDFERDFLSLTDAVVAPLDGGEPSDHAFIAVHRSHIVFVLADDEPGARVSAA
jgi:hypothetical protein